MKILKIFLTGLIAFSWIQANGCFTREQRRGNSNDLASMKNKQDEEKVLW